MLKRALILAALCLAAYPAHADGDGIRIANWPASANGTSVMVQNYQITGSTTAGQTVASYTVPQNVTFYLEYAEVEAYYLTFTTPVSNFGAAYLSANGNHGYTTQMAGAGISRGGFLTFNPPLAFPSSTVVSWLVSPAAGTGTVWYGNLGGYYK